MQAQFKKVCQKSDIPKDGMRIFNIDLIEFVIANRDSQFFAVYNKCPHMGGSLGDGSIDEKEYLTCPLHNWQFDLNTGKGPEGYEDSVPTFELDVRGESIFINQNQLLELGKNKDYLVKFDHNTK